MKKNNKIYTIRFRVTEHERNEILQKAKNYQSVSAFIVDACFQHSGRTLNLLNELEHYASVYSEFKLQLSHLGVNMNTLAEYVNHLKKVGVLSGNFIDEYVALLQDINVSFHSLIQLNEKKSKEIRDALHK